MFLGAVRTAKGKHGSTTYLQDLSNVNGDCRVRDNVQSLCILYQDNSHIFSSYKIWEMGIRACHYQIEYDTLHIVMTSTWHPQLLQFFADVCESRGMPSVQ
jgi:hypothetical protein